MRNVVKFIAFVIAYVIAIWAIMSYVPMFSTVAHTKMTGRLWFYTGAGFLFGFYVGSALLMVFRGARPLAYGRWDTSRERPSTKLGDFIGLVLASAVGIFASNMALDYALKRPF